MTPEEAFKVLDQAVKAWWPHRQKEGETALEVVYAELFGFEWTCPECGMTLPSTDTHCPNPHGPDSWEGPTV